METQQKLEQVKEKTQPRTMGYLDEEGVYHPNEAMGVDLEAWLEQVKDKMQPRTLGYIDEEGVYHGNKAMETQ